MPSHPRWESLIDPIGVEDFETDYFGKRPLHLPDRFWPATGLEDLEAWREALRGQRITHEGHRGRIEIDPKADQTQPLDAEPDSLIGQGGPLIIGSVNKINPAVEALAKAMAVGLASFVGVNAYISPHRKDALDLHNDDHDVIVLQLHGNKLWTLGSRVVRGVASSKFFTVNKGAMKADAIENDTFRTIETRAGDLLYLPRGLYHRATTSQGISIHLSFGIRRPTGLDFADLVMQRLISETATREYAPRLNPESGDAEVLAFMDQLRDRLLAASGDGAARDEFLEQYRAKFDGVTDSA
jgi:ribosomal protein L16 Arg81 hydroxylase